MIRVDHPSGSKARQDTSRCYTPGLGSVNDNLPLHQHLTPFKTVEELVDFIGQEPASTFFSCAEPDPLTASSTHYGQGQYLQEGNNLGEGLSSDGKSLLFQHHLRGSTMGHTLLLDPDNMSSHYHTSITTIHDIVGALLREGVVGAVTVVPSKSTEHMDSPYQRIFVAFPKVMDIRRMQDYIEHVLYKHTGACRTISREVSTRTLRYLEQALPLSDYLLTNSLPIVHECLDPHSWHTNWKMNTYHRLTAERGMPTLTVYRLGRGGTIEVLPERDYRSTLIVGKDITKGRQLTVPVKDLLLPSVKAAFREIVQDKKRMASLVAMEKGQVSPDQLVTVQYHKGPITVEEWMADKTLSNNAQHYPSLNRASNDWYLWMPPKRDAIVQYKGAGRTMLAVVRELTTHPVIMLKVGEYKTRTPVTKRVTFIQAPTGSGKTEEYRAQPLLYVLLVPTNRLGEALGSQEGWCFVPKGEGIPEDPSGTLVMTYEKGAAHIERLGHLTIVVDEFPQIFKSVFSPYTPLIDKMLALIMGSDHRFIALSRNHRFYELLTSLGDIKGSCEVWRYDNPQDLITLVVDAPEVVEEEVTQKEKALRQSFRYRATQEKKRINASLSEESTIELLRGYRDTLIKEGRPHAFGHILGYAGWTKVSKDPHYNKKLLDDEYEALFSTVKMYTYPNNSIIHINSNAGIDKHLRFNPLPNDPDTSKVVPLRVDASTPYIGIPEDTTMMFYTSAMREGVSIYHPFKHNIVDARFNLSSDPTGIDHSLQAFARLRTPGVPRYLVIKQVHGRVKRVPTIREVKEMAEHVASNSHELHPLDMYQSLFKDVKKAIDMSETIVGWQVSPSIVIGIYLEIKALSETVVETAKEELTARGIPYKEVPIGQFMLQAAASRAVKETQTGETYIEVRDNARKEPEEHKKLLKVIDVIEANMLDDSYTSEGLLLALNDSTLLQSMKIGPKAYKEFQETRSLPLSGIYSLVALSRKLDTVLDKEGKKLFNIRGDVTSTKVYEIKTYLTKLGCKSTYVDSKGEPLKIMKGKKGVRLGFTSKEEQFEGRLKNREYYPVQGYIQIRDPVKELNKYVPLGEQITVIL